MKCAATGTPYTVFGYKGKQVRDNIHSADLIARLRRVLPRPRARRGLQHRRRPLSATARCCEAIELCEEIAGRELQLDLRRDEPHRRPHLVDQRSRPSSRATTRSGGSQYDVPRDPRRDLRRQRRALGRSACADRSGKQTSSAFASMPSTTTPRSGASWRRRDAGRPMCVSAPGGARRDDRRARPGAPPSAEPPRPGRARRAAGALGAQLAARGGPAATGCTDRS